MLFLCSLAAGAGGEAVVLDRMNNVGSALLGAGDVDGGGEILEVALARKEALLGPRAAGLIDTLNNLGQVRAVFGPSVLVDTYPFTSPFGPLSPIGNGC